MCFTHNTFVYVFSAAGTQQVEVVQRDPITQQEAPPPGKQGTV